MDFKLTKTQMLQQELFRKFAETEVKPIAKDMDEAEDYDRELLQKLQKIGAFGIPYSREYGGQGADVLTYTLCMEEMSKVDASTGITLSVHTSLCCPCINEFGTEEQKQKYLRPLVDGSKIGCFGLTEPGRDTGQRRHAGTGYRRCWRTYRSYTGWRLLCTERYKDVHNKLRFC